jgi:hypothetical protein
MHDFILFSMSYIPYHHSKKLTSLPLGEAVSLRANISSWIRQLVVSQVFCLSLVKPKRLGQPFEAFSGTNFMFFAICSKGIYAKW